jgi:hypothetical protein
VDLRSGGLPQPARVVLALGAVAVVLAGCGGGSAAPEAQTLGERTWIDNASVLIDQLDDGVLASDGSGTDLATARAALANQSDLVVLLMANMAFGDCAESVRNVGVPTDRLRHVASTLSSACRILQRASTIFTRAATGSDARALLAASRLTLRASPLLEEAKVELAAIRGAPK